ncbi:MAG TPA: cell envelope integrity protein TolA [Solirubrobacteraceae bacterium]|jgi:hypothetical protein|nr:cell envelope integrity protein TolA [Solirubrobacteraceae bacterium]
MADLSATLRSLRERLGGHPASPWVAGGLAAVAAVLVVIGLVSLLGGVFSSGQPRTTHVVSLDSSWVPGQGSLADAPGFALLMQRSVPIAQRLESDRIALLADLERRKKEAAIRARKAALEAYRRALALAKKRRAEALARYRAQLRANALKRARQLADLRRRKAAYQKKLDEYNRLLRVAPGQECSLPEVRQFFNCHTGKLPTGKPKAKHG